MENRSQRGGRKVQDPSVPPQSEAKIVGGDIDLKQAGTLLGLIGVAVVVLSRISSNWLIVITSTSLSVASSLLAVHFLLGGLLMPPKLVDALEKNKSDVVQENTKLLEKFSGFDPDLLARIDRNSELLDRHSAEISNITSSINQQADGFWVPLSFDLFSLDNSEEFILPIRTNHVVRMMILTNRSQRAILEKYVSLEINNKPLPLYQYLDDRTPKPIESSYFVEEEARQLFELRLREEIVDADRPRFDREIGALKEKFKHNIAMMGRISVLLIVNRPLFKPSEEANLPPKGGDPEEN